MGEGATDQIFLVVPLHVLALKAQLVVLVSAFVVISTVWSVSCLLFFYTHGAPCPAICKSGGGGVPPCPMESAPLMHSDPKSDTPKLCDQKPRSRGFFCHALFGTFCTWKQTPVETRELATEPTTCVSAAELAASISARPTLFQINNHLIPLQPVFKIVQDDITAVIYYRIL